MSINKVLATLLLPLFVGAAWQNDSCGGNGVNNMGDGNGTRAQTGMWGGERVRLQVTEAGATIEYDCGHGSIDQPLVADANGKFDLTGTHVKERPGPQREGESNSHPASYTGQINGDKLTLNVTLKDTKERIGTFTLTRGRGVRIVKCL